jgi:hypothetical protein
MDGELKAIDEADAVRVRAILRRADHDAHGSRRMDSLAVGSLDVLESNDLSSDRID